MITLEKDSVANLIQAYADRLIEQRVPRPQILNTILDWFSKEELIELGFDWWVNGDWSGRELDEGRNEEA